MCKRQPKSNSAKCADYRGKQEKLRKKAGTQRAWRKKEADRRAATRARLLADFEAARAKGLHDV